MRKLTWAERARYSSLSVELQPLVIQLKCAAAAKGIDVFLTEGTRTFDRQAELYAQGRTAPGPVVTHAQPGHSWHNYGLAFDLCLCHPSPRSELAVVLDWDKPLEPVGKLARALGLDWGGDFSHPDENHFQYHFPGLTLSMLQAAYPEGFRAGESDPKKWIDHMQPGDCLS